MNTVKTLFTLLLAISVVGCAAPGAVQAAGVMGTPGPTATRTVTPSPTVDWKQTAVVAQATADEARRLDTQATAQHEALIQEQIRITEASEIREHEKFAGTATAAPTSVPLTQTARSVDLTATNAMMTLSSGQLTATFQAPTQAVAMIRVEYERRLGWVNYAALGGLAFFLFGIGVFALGKARAGAGPMVTYEQTVRGEALTEVPVAAVVDPIRQNDFMLLNKDEPYTLVVVPKNPTGGPGEERFYVPCSDDQLFELSVRVLDEGETLGINNWEGEGTTLTRKVIGRLRGYFQEKQLVKSRGAGRLAFNARGLALLRVVRERKPLPSSGAGEVGGDSPLNMSHENMAHVSRGGGGA